VSEPVQPRTAEPAPARRGPSIRRLLLGLNVFVLLVPLLAVALLRIYDAHLIEQTERRLIAESVIIGEAFRAEWLRASHLDPSDAPSHRPRYAHDQTFFPIEPVLGIKSVAERDARSPGGAQRDTPIWAAGRAVEPLLQRAKLINLTGVRVLDPQGCIIATTSDSVGACLTGATEVAAALEGHYHAVLRPRHSDEPAPPLTAISRGGSVRVFTATPVLSDGEVIAVVRMSRTTIEPLRALWSYRYTLFWALLACLALVASVSLFFSRTITRPVREIRDAAWAITRGEARRPLRPHGLVPAELHALSAALDEMTAQLQARGDYIAEFAANVSHELKTPLTSIRGASELLQDDWQAMDDPQRQRFLDNIDHDATRMQRLVTGLLHLARLENRAEQPALEPVDVGELLERLVARYPEPVTLTATLPGQLIVAAEHLRAAATNLIENALRHGTAPVHVRADLHQGLLRITVRDHGTGISAANAQRIFDRFFTTARDSGGTGLGLPIVRAIARARGGDITLQNTGPEGTTFVLTVRSETAPAA
jgi:signal transduction histidine kinase